MLYSDKASQLEADFGIPHPIAAMKAALGRRDDERDVSPYQAMTARKRIAELLTRPAVTGEMDAAVVMLMRGARVENVAVALGYEFNPGLWKHVDETGTFIADFRHHLSTLSWLDDLIGESQRGLNLWMRA